MKRIAMMSLILVLFGSVLIANAQTANFITAKIPFEFYIQGERMPAGEYRVATYGANGLLQFTCHSGNKIMATASIEAGERHVSGSPLLAFHQYGDTYFLSIVSFGTGGLKALPMTGAEREYQAKASGGPKVVAVAVQPN